jgi:RimJ/RimL family protein N-acetyltransferase
MLRLRPYKDSDANYLINWLHDEKQFTMWSAGKFTYPLTKEQLLEYKNRYDEDEFGWIFTTLNETGTPVGHFLMRMADYQKQSIHIGFIIVDEQHRGKGYGKEMLNLAIKYAFEILGVNRMTLGVFENNEAAHRCYRSVGLVDENYHKEFFPFKDEKWGLYDMAIERRN